MLLLGPDNAIVMSDAAADAWLDELRETVPAIPCRRRSARSPPALAGSRPTRARSRRRPAHASGPRGEAGSLVRGSALGSEPDALTAVTLEPARPRDLAPLIADAYGLTPRERAVTQLVAEGLPTSAIARRLYLSAWTVQDHLKVIFRRSASPRAASWWRASSSTIARRSCSAQGVVFLTTSVACAFVGLPWIR